MIIMYRVLFHTALYLVLLQHTELVLTGLILTCYAAVFHGQASVK